MRLLGPTVEDDTFYPQRLGVYGRRTEGKRDVSRERVTGAAGGSVDLTVARDISS